MASRRLEGPAGHRACRLFCFFFFQAEDGIRDYKVTGVQTCALPISAENVGYDFSLLRGVAAVNEAQFTRVVGKIRSAAGGVQGVRVAVWGLTFKADKIGRASCRERV